MRKAGLILMVLLVSFLPGAAKTEWLKARRVQMLEGEIRGGFTLPVDPYHGGKAELSLELAIEGRYNIKDTPFDCGLMLGLTTANRNFNYLWDSENAFVTQNNRTLVLAVTGDYNFRQGRTVNPFVGTALGIGFNDTVGTRLFPSKGTSFVFMPRGGVEIAGFLRLMAEFNVCRKGYNNFALTVGFVLGGRPKKQEVK